MSRVSRSHRGGRGRRRYKSELIWLGGSVARAVTMGAIVWMCLLLAVLPASTQNAGSQGEMATDGLKCALNEDRRRSSKLIRR